MKQINDLWFFGTVTALLIMMLLFNSCQKDPIDDMMPPITNEPITYGSWTPFIDKQVENFTQTRNATDGTSQTRTVEITVERVDIPGTKHIEGFEGQGNDRNSDGDLHDYVISQDIYTTNNVDSNRRRIGSGSEVYQDNTGDILIDYAGTWYTNEGGSYKAIVIDSTGIKGYTLQWGHRNDYVTCWKETPSLLLPLYARNNNTKEHNPDLEFDTEYRDGGYHVVATNVADVETGSGYNVVGASLHLTIGTPGSVRLRNLYGDDIVIGLQIRNLIVWASNVTDPITGVESVQHNTGTDGGDYYMQLKYLTLSDDMLEDFGNDFNLTNKCN